MAEKIEELNLPVSIISRLIKEALPPGVSIRAEARSAITRAASVFILYLTSTANTVRVNDKKIITARNIFEALEENEFENFVQPLKESLESFKQMLKSKKDKKTDETGKENDKNKSLGTSVNDDEESNEAEK